MAYLPLDDKEQTNLADPNQSGQVAPGATSTLATSGGGGDTSTVSSGTPSVSSVGIGSGGTNAWTNIQAYLNANQGNTGTANVLKSTVGSQFDQEQQKFNNDSTQAKTKAQGQVDNNAVSQDQASKMIQDAGSQYQYGKPQTDAYNATVNGLKSKLNAQYQGPTSFSYGMGADTQNYGDNLANDQGFHGIMNALYNKAAGGQMGSGALALQEQLDVNNPYVNQTRSDLQGQYSGLKNTLNTGIQDTNTALSNAQKAFAQNEADEKGYLASQATDRQKAISDAVAQEKANDLATQQDRIRTNWTGADVAPWDPTGYGAQFNNESQFTNGKAVRDYVQYNPATVTNENATGVDDQRNQFNAILDALGRQDKIQKQDPFTPGNWTFNSNQWGKDFGYL